MNTSQSSLLQQQVELKAALLPHLEEWIQAHPNDPEIVKHRNLILWSLLKIIERVESLDQNFLDTYMEKFFNQE